MIATSLKIMRPNISNNAGIPMFECGVGGFIGTGTGTFVASSYNSRNSITPPLSLTMPVGIAVGDLMILTLVTYFNRSTEVNPDWTLIKTTADSNTLIKVYYRIATGADSLAFTESGYQGASALLSVFRGVSTITVGAEVYTTASTTVCIPGITMPAAGILVAYITGGNWSTTHSSASLLYQAGSADSYSATINQMYYAQQGAFFTGNRLFSGNYTNRIGFLLGLT